MRLVHNPPVRVPDQTAPLRSCVTRRHRVARDLIDIVPTRWLAADDFPCAVDGVGGYLPPVLVGRLKDATGRFAAGQIRLGLTMFLGGEIALGIRHYPAKARFTKIRPGERTVP